MRSRCCGGGLGHELTCKVRWDLDGVIGTWDSNYSVLLLLRLLLLVSSVGLSLLNALLRVLLVLLASGHLPTALAHILLVLICALILSVLLLRLLLSRLRWPQRNLDVRPRYGQCRLPTTTNFCLCFECASECKWLG